MPYLIGIDTSDNKENHNFLMEPHELHNRYKRKNTECDENINQANFEDYLKEQEPPSRYYDDTSEPTLQMEPDSKTQNTQDYRKREDLALEEMGFNFSAEKAVNKFTRIEIYPENDHSNTRKFFDELEFVKVSLYRYA
jgi:hypothetical protein